MASECGFAWPYTHLYGERERAINIYLMRFNCMVIGQMVVRDGGGGALLEPIIQYAT